MRVNESEFEDIFKKGRRRARSNIITEYKYIKEEL